MGRDAWDWKMIAGMSIGVVVSGVSFFLLEGSRHATHEDVRGIGSELRRYVDEHSPYMKDKGTIFTRLDEIEARQREILDEVGSIKTIIMEDRIRK